MGDNRLTLKELETNEIVLVKTKNRKGPCGPVKVIYARERTFLALKAERLLIRTLVDTLDGEATKCFTTMLVMMKRCCFQNDPTNFVV